VLLSVNVVDNAVHIVQVKDHLELRLKMIVMILLSNIYNNILGRRPLHTLSPTLSICHWYNWRTVEGDRYLWTLYNVLLSVNVVDNAVHIAQVTNHTSVHCVTKVSAIPAPYSDINFLCTATADNVSVLTVGSCLR